jgi:hypothetical protein
MRFAEFLAGVPATEERLAAYLTSNPEWVRLEFKEAKQVPVHGLRISIAALATTEGGDLFVGVTDDNKIVGCSFDPSALSTALAQTGAPYREDVRTNLVEVVGDPTTVGLASGNRVYWLDVPQYGWVVAALKADGTLGLYDRPGANSPEVVGLSAVDFYQRPNRARLLRRVYEEAAVLGENFQYVYQGPGKINDDTVDGLRRLISSKEWDLFARKVERSWVQNEAYLAPFLRLPMTYATWGNTKGPSAYQKEQGEMIQVKGQLTEAIKRIREYLEQQRILPKA